jgi:hypothetical protein
MGNCMWRFLELKAWSICAFYSLIIWTIVLSAHLLTLMLFKFSRWWNLREPYQPPKFRLVIMLSQVLVPSTHLKHLEQKKSLAPMTTSPLPRTRLIVFPVWPWCCWNIWSVPRWDTLQRSDHVTDPWGPTDASIYLSRRHRTSKLYIWTSCACCDASPSGTSNLLRKIRVSDRWTITIPYETTIQEFFIRDPDITLASPRDLSRFSSMPYSSIITIFNDQWGDWTWSY